MPSRASDNAPATSVYADLVSRGQELAIWQNELLRQVARRGTLTEDDIATLADAALKEAEQQEIGFDRLTHDDFPTPASPDTQVQLVSLGRLTHVNALRNDQTLRFGPNLTIIYGHNASGKSGYARVLKKVFRARVVDDILPDLRSDESGAAAVASATFAFASPDDAPRPWEWRADGGTLPSDLARFAVLDDKCSRTYIADSELAVRPAGLDIPERAATEIDRVQAHLKALAAKARPNKAVLEALVNDSDAGRFVAGLSATTTEQEVVQYTRFDDEDRRNLEAVEAELADLKRDAPDERRKRLANEKRNAQSLLAFAGRIERQSSDDAVTTLRNAQAALERAEEAATRIRTIGDDATRDDLLGSDPWRALIRAALDFVRHDDADRQSVAIDGRCSLCWQDLDADAQQRVDRFTKYLTSDVEGQVASAKQALVDTRDAAMQVPAETPPAEAELARNVSPDFAAELEDYVAASNARVRAMTDALTTSNWTGIPPRGVSVRPTLERLIADVTEKERAASDEADTTKRLRELEARRLSLSTRQTLTPLRETISDFVHALRTAQRYESVATAINTRKLSQIASELNDKYLTAAFTESVERELKHELGFARHAPKFSTKTNKAKLLLRPVVSADLKNIQADRVFSEGERTAIALACFLAETGITSDTAGLIFDDPISSLDHGIRLHVASRLVKEASRRQVIVFTHDLSFFADLRRAAKDQGVSYESRTLSADEWSVGTIEDDMPFGARGVKERIKVLRKMIEAMKAAGAAGDANQAAVLKRQFYDRLRGTWERFVEADMFGGAVERLEREVRPGLLHQVVATEDVRARVTQNYTRCSNLIEAHDTAPAAAGQAAPTTADMEADLQQLEDARQVVLQGRKTK